MEDRTGSEITRALDSLWKPDASRQERIMRGFREATELRESRTGLGLATLGSLLLGAVVIITLVIGRWATSGHPILPLTVPATAAHARLFAMLADNTVVAFDNGATTPAWTARLAPPPQAGQNGYIPTGHYIALSADETLVYALPLSESRGARELDVLDAGTGRVLRRHSFAGTGILYGTLSVGPQSGWLYIVGQGARGVQLTILDRQGDRVLGNWTVRDMSTWTARGLAPGDYFFYEAAVTPDESRVYFDYYGARLDLSGIDWVDLDLSRRQAEVCSSQQATPPCIGAYAGFQLFDGNLIITDTVDTRRGQLALVSSNGGEPIKRYTVGLEGFVNDFALDPSKQTLYVVGSCAYRGGLVSVDVTSGHSTQLSPLGQPGSVDLSTVCGQRTALLNGSRLFVGQVPALLAHGGRNGVILIVDTATGATSGRLATPAEVLDLIVAA